MTLLRILPVIGFMALLSCNTATIESEYDPQADFSSYQTYTVCMDDLDTVDGEHPLYDSPENREYVSNAIAMAMDERGYAWSEASPDLHVGFQIMLEDREVTVTQCSGYANKEYWPECTLNTYHYVEGTLVISVSDLATNQVIWQGSANGILNTPDAKMKKLIDKTVQQIFEQYPIQDRTVLAP